MLKLLVIDDDPAVRKLVGFELNEDYEVIGCGDPEEGLALALAHRPDAILLDLHMPKYSGFELLRTYSDFSHTQAIPIIIVSGEASDLTRTRCKDMGAVAVFSKPIDFDALRSCLGDQTRVRKHMPARSEVRVRLNILLTLKGPDSQGKTVEESVTTEAVSVNGFLCNSDADFPSQGTVDVFKPAPGKLHVGKATIIGVESRGATRHYQCKFLKQPKDWVLH